VSLYGTPSPTLTMTSTGKKQQTTLGGSSDGSFGLTFSGGSTPAGFVGTKADGKGYLELNDSSGSKMVEAAPDDNDRKAFYWGRTCPDCAAFTFDSIGTKKRILYE
jgi:hypothetical protein